VEARVRHLRGLLEAGLREIPAVTIASPLPDAMKGGMVSFAVEGLESGDLQRHLSTAANVRTRVIGEYGYGWMRLSTHVYNTPREIERVLGLVADAARNGIPA